jgi:hypothetical protein
MKIINLVVFQLTLTVICAAQSYEINHFQSTYDTIIDYNSVNIELGVAGEDPYYWEKNFDFGFEFPFFGDTFDNVFIDSDGFGSFPESSEYNLNLFAGIYIIATILDTPYLHSEVRYASTIVNQLNVLVIEYYNVFATYEYNKNGENHSISFQMWFYENGTIELHFGPIDLAQCTHYFPGQGFSFDNEDPVGNIYGPWMKINNNDLSESACFGGDHSNPTILYDNEANCDVLTSIPPEGYVVQFLPSNISAVEPLPNKSYNLFLCTQSNGVIEIVGDERQYKSCSVHDLMGRKIGYSTDSRFSINTDGSQLYILVIEREYGQESHMLFIE